MTQKTVCEGDVHPVGQKEHFRGRRVGLQALSQTRRLDEQVDQIRYSGSEDFKLLGERWCRIVGVPRLSFAHHVNHFDP